MVKLIDRIIARYGERTIEEIIGIVFFAALFVLAAAATAARMLA